MLLLSQSAILATIGAVIWILILLFSIFYDRLGKDKDKQDHQ